MATSVTFYKQRGMKLPTVVFDGPTFYEFVRTGPDMFEYVAETDKAIKTLTKYGYPVKEEPLPEKPPEQQPTRKPSAQAKE